MLDGIEVVPANPYVQYPHSLRAVRQLLCDDMVHCRPCKGTADPYASKKTHIWKKNLVTITGPVDRTCVEDVKVCTTTKHDASSNENTATSIPVPFNDVRGMIAASLLSPDEYTMRIATQTESALICRVLVPIYCLSNSGVPGTTENAFSDGRALKVHTVQGVVQTDHHRAVFWPR
ncbi:hypothetical protein TNCV_2386591 [Trichonephila clavipes]|nr:hypothetical protein TNCV_2386591 [Trichonephila clavipes]